MRSAGVPGLGLPLVRLNPWYPGQQGVEGTDSETGLRTSVTGAVFYVDPNYPGVSDLRDGTNPLDPLRTVQAAIDKCESYRNDVIIVGANGGWTYAPGTVYPILIAEEVVLNKHGVRLVGAFPSGLGVPWEPVTAAGAGTCITVTAMDCLVEGFAFMGGLVGGRAIYAEWGGGLYGENFTVRHCTFEDTIDIAVQLEYAWYCAVHDCHFQGCGDYGIYVDPLNRGIMYAQIYNNHFQDCATSAIAGAIDRSLIRNNWLYNSNAAQGLAATDELIDLAAGGRNLVSHNALSCLLPTGVPLSGDYDDTCEAGAADAWVQNYCINGPSVANPA